LINSVRQPLKEHDRSPLNQQASRLEKDFEVGYDFLFG
jgi:hypothetical protein